MKKVAILGTGPAAMFAAHAASAFPVEITILGPKTPSVLRGAQYLHKHVPGITDPQCDFWVDYMKLGTIDGYSQKVYGEQRPDVSWNLYPDGQHPAWDLRLAYRTAYSMYHKLIVPVHLKPEDISAIDQDYDLVISTIPLPVLVGNWAWFNYQEVWITSWECDAAEPAVIVYNGMLDGGWYRYSQIQGWAALERSFNPNDGQAVAVKKPLGYDESRALVPLDWLLVGRYGAWNKKALAHDSYKLTRERMFTL